MKYKLEVTKYEKNQNYKEELKEWKEKRNWSPPYNRREEIPNFPDKTTKTRSLLVDLSEEEFLKLKQEVIKIFK